MIYAVNHYPLVMVQAGCKWLNLDDLSAAVTKTHGDNAHGRVYQAAIAYLRAYAAAYWSRE